MFSSLIHFLNESPWGRLVLPLIGLISGLVGIMAIPDIKTFILTGIVLVVIFLVEHRRHSKLRIPLWEHPAIAASIDLLEDASNAGIRVQEFSKNVSYDHLCRTSNVTYFIRGTVSASIKNGVNIAIGGGSDRSHNLHDMRYFMSSGSSLGIRATEHFCEIGADALKKLSGLELQPKEVKSNKNACLYYLPFRQSLSRNATFEICLYYEWKGAIFALRDSTTYLCKSQFKGGVDHFSTSLRFIERPFGVKLIAIDVLNRKAYEMPTNDVKFSGVPGRFELSYQAIKPTKDLIIEREIENDNPTDEHPLHESL
jgi:hypothetical protein